MVAARNEIPVGVKVLQGAMKRKKSKSGSSLTTSTSPCRVRRNVGIGESRPAVGLCDYAAIWVVGVAAAITQDRDAA